VALASGCHVTRLSDSDVIGISSLVKGSVQQ
jgi:hypothetical protein